MVRAIQAIYIFIGLLLMGLFFTSCHHRHEEQAHTSKTIAPKGATEQEIDSLVYQSENLIIRKISPNVYEHTSFLMTDGFGKVPCNGIIVVDQGEAIVFDTPADNETSAELITYFSKNEPYTIKAVIATHFHGDCVGGLNTFHKYQIPSYANNRTIALLKQQKSEFDIPENGFSDTLKLTVGDKKVEAAFLGEGHTKDNIIGYFPEDNVLFGGCLIKEVGAEKGNLEDATIEAWAETVEKVKQNHPQAKIIIPGHGKQGGVELLDYTIELFK